MTTFRFHLLLATFLVAVSRLVLAEPAEVKSPLSPEESLQHFQLDSLLSIELVAAEPEVVDPVAIRFDEDGRLWVAEMRDYPLGPIKKIDGKRTETTSKINLVKRWQVLAVDAGGTATIQKSLSAMELD